MTSPVEYHSYVRRFFPASVGLFSLMILPAVFLASGYDKLFRTPAKWLTWFHQHGFPPYFAYIAGALEFFGAILLVLGLMTRLR